MGHDCGIGMLKLEMGKMVPLMSSWNLSDWWIFIVFFKHNVVIIGVLKQEENVKIKNIVNVYLDLVVLIVVVVC
jgi:hypothetical protein